MSKQLESIANSLDANERLDGYEKFIGAYRHQLDKRLTVSDLSDDQRDLIIKSAFRRVERLSDSEREVESFRLQVNETLTDSTLSDEQKQSIVENAINDVSSYPEGFISTNAAEEIYLATRWLAQVADPNTEYEGRISSIHQQALKYYTGTLFEMVRATEADGDQLESERLANTIYTSYLSCSPDIASYTGGVTGQLELLSYANRSSVREFIHNLSGEIIYNGAFSGDDDIFAEEIITKDPIAQLELLNTASELAKQAIYQGEWAEPFSHKVVQELVDIAQINNDVSPFVRIAAATKAEDLHSELTQEWSYLSDFPIEKQMELVKNDRLRREQDAMQQQRLHQAFPEAGKGRLVQLSNDAAGRVGSDSIDSVFTADGRQTLLVDIEQRNDLSVSEEEAVLLRAVHNSSVRESIEAEIGIQLKDLTLDTQRHLLKFMVEADNERYSQLIRALSSIGYQRHLLAEAFLATEFGDELGDSILAIAEKEGHESEATEIFTLVSLVRDRLGEWESEAWFAQEECEYQGYFAGIKLATESRISQILSLVPDLMDGKPQQAMYFHRDGSVAETVDFDSVNEVIMGLKLLELEIRKITAAESIPASEREPDAGEDFTAANATVEDASVRVMLRPYETANAEARARWVSIITPDEQLEIFGQFLAFDKHGNPKSVKSSLHLDLEEISGRVSWDLGSRMEHAAGLEGFPDRLLAGLVTAGVQHNARVRGEDIRNLDYHVRDAFPPELSNRDYFADYIRAMEQHYVDPSRLKLGKAALYMAGIRNLEIQDGPKVAYTGLFFDEEEMNSIKQLVEAKYTNQPNDLHVTIKFRPKDGLQGVEVGKQIPIRIVGIVDDGKAQALVVQSDEINDVSDLHITLSTAFDGNGKRIPPVYGKKAVRDMKSAGEVNWFEKPIELTTTMGYLDSRTNEIVLGEPGKFALAS